MKGIAFTVTGSQPFNSNVKELRRRQKHEVTYDFYYFFFSSKPVFRVLGSHGHQLTYTLIVPAQYNSPKRFRRRRRGEFRNLKKLYNKD